MDIKYYINNIIGTNIEDEEKAKEMLIKSHATLRTQNKEYSELLSFLNNSISGRMLLKKFNNKKNN